MGGIDFLGIKMAGATQRGYKAGLAMGGSIIEMVHLMYQNNTAARFYDGLSKSILQEMRNRGLFNGKETQDNESPKRIIKSDG